MSLSLPILWSISAFSKSREKRFITKECIATYTHLNFAFKKAFHFSTLAIKLFNSGMKLFQAGIATATP